MSDEAPWQQLGIGGLLIYLFLREMFLFLSKKRDSNGTNGHSGDKPVSYWQLEFRDAVNEVTHDRFVELDRKQQEMLALLYDLQRRTPRR